MLNYLLSVIPILLLSFLKMLVKARRKIVYIQIRFL